MYVLKTYISKIPKKKNSTKKGKKKELQEISSTKVVKINQQ